MAEISERLVYLLYAEFIYRLFNDSIRNEPELSYCLVDDKGKGKVFEDAEHHEGLKVNKGMHMIALSQSFHLFILVGMNLP